MARTRPDKSLARFERIALVLSGGGALGVYHAGAYAALETCGIRPNWIAGTSVGAINAVLIAGNLPHERSLRLRQFWQELGRRISRQTAPSVGRSFKTALRGAATRLKRQAPEDPEAVPGTISSKRLRELIEELVDFDRVNSGNIRIVLGAVNVGSGAEAAFDNDRHVIGVDHVLASTPFPGLPPITIGDQTFAGAAVPIALLDEARPADSLCFVIDGYDPPSGRQSGISRSIREIGVMRRTHDLRRMIALLGERLGPSLGNDAELRKCLSEASNATLTVLHLVHEGSTDDLAAKMADYSAATLMRRWQAGETDVTTSLAHPLWLAPPPRRLGAVVHELRGGVAAPPR